MSKKHVFLQFFSKIAIFACVFCAFFIPSAFATLPAGYTELEYIESTGTQYIDTGFKPDVNTKIHTKIISTKKSADASIFGCSTLGRLLGGDNYVIDLYMNENFIGIASNKSAYSTPVSTQFNTPYEITFTPNNNELKINDNVFNVGLREYTSNLDAYLFARNYNNNADLRSTVQMYYFEIYANNILVRNFIPAKRNSDNVVGMYDTVSNTFFTNAGTGSFIAGPVFYGGPI